MKKRRTKKRKQALAAALVAVMTVSCLPSGLAVTDKAAAQTTLSLAGASAFSMEDVTVTDAYYSNALQEELSYLEELDENKLLAGFKETAGYASGMTETQVAEYMGTTRYIGGDNWENSLIGGHTLGHYMTALAQAVSNAGTPESDKKTLQEKLDTIIATLKECQEMTVGSDACSEGYLFGATLLGNTTNLEFQFDNVEKNRTNISTQAWVPWYTMHKILSGLLSVYELTGDTDALAIAQGLGDWTYNRVSQWSDSTRKIVLNIEYGGMNDALYELALCTDDSAKQANYLAAAAQFDETIAVGSATKSLYQMVLDGDENCLNDKHANTTIPKFLGALNRYTTLSSLGMLTESDEIYLEYAEAFWTMVVEKHSYITGGSSEWEHFGKDYVLDSERTNCNNETCNTYNMLKLSRKLFQITGNVKYADYYENVLINAIVASQNPETGMSMYFQPMKSGYFKVYSTKTEDFWCCTGSGMENFTKLNDSIYFYKDNCLIVNQYLSSTLAWEDENLKLTQEADLLTGTEQTFTLNAISGSTTGQADLYLRIPDYAAGDVTVTVDGEAYDYETVDGYAKITGAFANGTVIAVTIPEEVTYENLTDPEATDTYAFRYGPYVLAADLGTENTSDSDIGVTGVTVNIPTASTLDTENIQIDASVGSLDDWLANLQDYMVKTVSNGTVSFTMKGTDKAYTFVPYYQIYESRYGIYWNFGTDEAGLVLRAKTEARDTKQLDVLQPGYGQNESDAQHALTDNGSSSSSQSGNYRRADAGGSFSYRMAVSADTDTTLVCRFSKEDNGKTIKITVGDTVIASETLAYDGTEDFYTKYYTIPLETAQANWETYNSTTNVVRIVFSGIDAAESAALYNELYTYEKIGTTAELTSVTSDTGTVSQSDSEIQVSVAEGTESVSLTFSLADTNGYVTFEGEAFDETKAKTFNVSSTSKLTGTIRVYAEDFTTYQDYTLSIEKGYEQDETLLYFVDCGDYDVTTVSAGDSLGLYNSVTDQVYGTDPITGYTWGIVDTVSSPLKNGTSSVAEDAVYTDQTWPYEYLSGDGADKTESNRYTKNQYENGESVRFLDYAFALENGTYTVEVGFCNPWSCSTNPNLYANYGKDNQTTIAAQIGVPANGTKTVTGTVTVTDGVLTLNARSNENDSTTLAINMTYIKISKVTGSTEKTLKLSKVKVKTGKKKITGKISVKNATVSIKVGKKSYKKATVSGKKFTLKTSKLKKGTKVKIKVTKSGYTTLKKSYTVK